MIVKLTKDEILQACREWALRRHGLTLSGNPEVGVIITSSRGDREPHVADDIVIKFSEAKGQGPYRDSG